MSHRSLTRIVLFFAVVAASPVFAQDSAIWERNTLSNPLVTAIASGEQVRFRALALAQRVRLEVLSQSGELLYDSDFQPGNLLEWTVQNQQGFPLADGLYGCIVTVEELSGRVTYRRGVFRVADGKVSFDAPDPSRLVTAAVDGGEESLSILCTDERFPFAFVGHDGTDARIESTAGGLILHAGRFFAGESNSSPHMRLTPEGNLGIGVREPAAKLDVAGLIRTSEGIQFPDGSILKSASGLGGFSIFASSRQGILPDSGASTAGTGSGPSGRALGTSRLSMAASGVKQMTAAGGGIGRVYGTEGYNTYYGSGAGSSNTTGYGNSFFGWAAGGYNTTGNENSFFGDDAGVNNTTGGANSFFGWAAGGYNTTGWENSFFGIDAGGHNTTGNENSFFGAGAGGWNTTGSNNSFVGYNAGSANTTGSNNSFVGYNAGWWNTTGGGNSFFGDSAGRWNTTGYDNSFFGYQAGNSNTTESNNAFIGASSDGAAGITNATAVGYKANVTRSNSLVLGGVNGFNGATEETNVGIGTTSPDRQLTVEGTQALGRFRRYYGTADPFTATFAPAFLFERARPTQAAPTDILAGDYLGKVQFRGRVGGIYPEYGAIAFIASDTKQNGRFAFLDRDIATERVSILNTGNVGIGTTAPTERLHVVGNIKVTGTITYGAPETDIPDYVFDPNYKLMTPEDLGKFVAREKHLPNVPAADEIREKGLNLSEFQMKLLEKVEELTLYTVQQAKTNREQQAALERKEAEIALLNARLAALEQMMEGLMKQQPGK